jgi:SAM-dependent methyltransferase
MTGSAEFTGAVPRFYDRCLGPVLFEPFAADLVSRLPSAEGLRVLEVACGTGVVTRRLRQALRGSAQLVATDLNEAMLSYARQVVPAGGIDWQPADAQALPFPDSSFDVLVCQFGFMFLPDKPQGFREARRVLSPGGLLLGNVWCSRDENPALRVLQTVLERLFPANPPRFLDTPYGYHDNDRLRADMAAGGWQDVQLETVTLESESPSASEFATGFVRGSPLTHELLERGVDLDAVTHEIAQALAHVGGDKPFRPTLAATIISATS